jgi:hypothetical protein
LLDRDAGAREHRLEREVVLAIERRVGNARGQCVEFVARGGREVDSRRKRLPEPRLDGEAAQAQRLNGASGHQGRRHQGQLEDRFCTHAVPSPNAFCLKQT